MFQIAKLTKEAGSSAEYCKEALRLGHKGAIQERLKLVLFLKDNNNERNFCDKLALSLKAEEGDIDALLSLISHPQDSSDVKYWLSKILYHLDTHVLLEHFSLFFEEKSNAYSYGLYRNHYRLLEERELTSLSDHNRKWEITTALAKLGIGKYACQQLEADDKHKLIGALSEIYVDESDDKKEQYIAHIKTFIEKKNSSEKEKELDDNVLKRQAALALLQQKEFAQYAREAFYQGEDLSGDFVLNFLFSVIPQLDFTLPGPEIVALAKETKFDEAFYSQFFKLLNKNGIWDETSQETIRIETRQKRDILENLTVNAVYQGRYLTMMKSYISSLEAKDEHVTEAQKIYELFQESHLQAQSYLQRFIETEMMTEEHMKMVDSILGLTFGFFKRTFGF